MLMHTFRKAYFELQYYSPTLPQKVLKIGGKSEREELIDAKASERKNPDLPMQPGHVLRREFVYIRHGILHLMESRSAFLHDPTHQVVFYSTPMHASRTISSRLVGFPYGSSSAESYKHAWTQP
jgi:hypothetical protein